MKTAPTIDNITHLSTEEHYKNFLSANPDSLVVMKFFAPWCRACKGLEPKFVRIATSTENKNVVFAQFNVQNNKEFVKSLGILALPNVHFYGEQQILESFPCGPSKVPILRRKLVDYVVNRVDPSTGALLPPPQVSVQNVTESAPCAVRKKLITPDQEEMIRSVTYFADMPDEDFQEMLSKVTVSSFEPGSTIMKQGFEGFKFYVIASGEVEVKARTGLEDPLTTPASYDGTVVNRLDIGNFFGERSLITGEPRAATIKAVRSADTTRCFTFKQEDIPSSCVLSGKNRESISKDMFDTVDNKYAAGANNAAGAWVGAQVEMANVESQNVGSIHPGAGNKFKELEPITEVIPLLQRFKMVRTAARCFEHIMRTSPKWGDPAALYRRSLLVGQLTETQKAEFTEVFEAVASDVADKGQDTKKKGEITLLDLKRTMESIGKKRTDSELAEMINKANPAIDGNVSLRFDEFMGMIAEAEFYYLFVDTFNALDVQNSGYIRAGDLRAVLAQMGGVALGSDERTSIVKVDDDDMLIDYDYFSRMLIGA